MFQIFNTGVQILISLTPNIVFTNSLLQTTYLDIMRVLIRVRYDVLKTFDAIFEFIFTHHCDYVLALCI
ncbi:hypothetical protein DJ84_14890 [Halorubrum ezzemoulense]|nr:hypothetical protein DJ84_14890 [Halorubrum ezzemoulense]